jgi:nucleoside-diphosphate-sugar epimerase
MRKVIITGGKGYIARNLVPLFEKGGYEVIAPSRQELDLLDQDNALEYVLDQKPSILIHAAGKGGNRQRKDTWDDVFVPNMLMWESIQNIIQQPDVGIDKVILFGSGAEFDRRVPISNALESEQEYATPLDPYGLSKWLITRYALASFSHTYVLRLFGCFNWDDDPGRFIKAGILNLKRGLPIEVHQNKWMDYFYLDDIYTVIDYIIQNPYCPRHMNLTYKNKMSLLDIASLIHKHTNIFDPIIKLNETGIGSCYTGDGSLLANLPVELLGLEEGIRRTALKLT